MSEQPSPLDSIGHTWVGGEKGVACLCAHISEMCVPRSEWLKDIGLECYQQTFHDARIDANMLNSITFVNIFDQ